MKRTFTQILSLALLIFGMQAVNAQDQIFEVNSPAGLQGGYEFGQASAPDWGGALSVGESVTGDLVMVVADTLAGDLEGDTEPQGCVELLNGDDIAGNVALVDRGSCFFSDKVWWAQEAGAIAVVICNVNANEGVINLGAGGDFAGLDTIPTGMLSLADCDGIKEAMNNGETVNVTFSVQEFVNLSTAPMYQTPVNHITPIMDIGVDLYNNTADTVDVEVTWTITDPNGVETVLSTTGEVDITGARFSIDEPYTPEAVGTYTIVATNSINDFELTQNFIINDTGIFTDDNGQDDFVGIGVSNERFADPAEFNLTYDYGMQMLTGNPDFEESVLDYTFGLSNWTEILTDAQSSVDFTIIVYGEPTDVDGNPLDIIDVSSYDEFGAPLGFTLYSATGDEQDNDLVTVEFASPPALPNNGRYYIFMQYNGENVANGVCPQYLASGTGHLQVPANSNPLVGASWFTGWSSNPGMVTRARVGNTSNTEEVLTDNEFTLSPNPTTSELNLNLDLDNVSSEVTVHIFDPAARLLLNETYDNVREANFNYDVSAYNAGIYFVQIITEEGSAIKKFIKQ